MRPTFAFTTVDLATHAVNWYQQCRRRRKSVFRTWPHGARCQYTKAQALPVWFLVYLLQTCLHS